MYFPQLPIIFISSNNFSITNICENYDYNTYEDTVYSKEKYK